MSVENTVKFEYTNSCTCQTYDPEIDEYFDAQDCYGDCWEYTVEDFANITSHLFEANETDWWKVTALRLWNGDVSGFFSASNVQDLIRGMTVNSEWTMRGEVFNDRIEYSLSHHDAPMGSSSVLTMVSENEREEYGLY